MSAREQFESNYDPTDADKAMQVGYVALQLMRSVKLALDADTAGFKLGRDLHGDLFAHTLELGRQLRSIRWDANSKQIEEWMDSL